jgi:uncharacterized protein with GYD domain
LDRVVSQFIILTAFHGDAPELRLDVQGQNAKFDKILAAVGATSEYRYWTAGAYDVVMVAEFTSVETAAACAVAIRADMNASATVLTSLTAQDALVTAVEAARPATGRGVAEPSVTEKPATGRDA